jgi:peptidyl-prolyl cis-trans isomerase D
MLDLMRRKKRLKLILWLVILSLALGMLLFFVPGTDMESIGTTDAIAKVDGKAIPLQTFTSLYRRTVERLSDNGRNKIDRQTLNAMGVPSQVLDDLIKVEIIQLMAQRLGISVTPDEVRRAVETHPNLQDQGKFIGVERYKELLAANNYSIADFESSLSRELLTLRVHGIITSSLTVGEKELRDEFARTNQKTQVNYVLLKKEDYKKRIKPTDAEMQSYFDSHREAYRVKEKRRAQYLLIPASPLLSKINVSEQDIRDEWNKRSHQEAVEAAHILFLVEDPAKDAEIKQKAEAVLKKAKAGEDFADLAKKFSGDTGSAAKGGYLGPLQRGQTVKEFEEAAFSMQAGEISGLVKTQYGYHIIKVLKRETPTLESNRASLTAAIMQRKAQELAKAKAEEAVSLIGKQQDFAQVAKNPGIEAEVKETGFFLKEDNPFEFGISQAMRDEIFELKQVNAIGKLVEHPLGFAISKLVEVQLPRPGLFAESRAQVEKDYIDFKAGELMQAEAQRISKEAGKQGNLEKVAKDTGLKAKKSEEFTLTGTPDPEIGANSPFNKAAFDLQPGEVSSPQPVLENLAVFQVTSRSQFDESAFQQQKNDLQKRMLQSIQDPYFQEYLRRTQEDLEKTGKIKINSKVLERASLNY